MCSRKYDPSSKKYDTKFFYVFWHCFVTQKMNYNRLNEFKRALIYYRDIPYYPRKVAQLYVDVKSKIAEIQFSQREVVF